jgi:hypothetical protein
MNPREIEQFMRDSGFSPKRKTGSGMLWFDGLKYVNVAHRYSSPVALKNLQADVKRIVRATRGHGNSRGESRDGTKDHHGAPAAASSPNADQSSEAGAAEGDPAAARKGPPHDA